MRVEQLECIAAVARLGSFRRAAEEMHLSQPALSATVRTLERELGVTMFERGRSGARVSSEGVELMPLIDGAIDAVARLRRAARDGHSSTSVVRVGTVGAGTVPLLTTTISAFQVTHPLTQVEIVRAQEDAIDSGLRDGTLDLGLVTHLVGDDLPPGLETTRLLSGRVIACIHADSPLASLEAVSVADLLSQPLIVMRVGYLMHRYLHRVLGGRTPAVFYSTDGGEMGKQMVAQGLGTMLLPDFSVLSDPLTLRGVITWRPLADDSGEVQLAIRRRLSHAHPRVAGELHALFGQQAAAYSRSA